MSITQKSKKQNKQAEQFFFQKHSESGAYDVLDERTNEEIVTRTLALTDTKSKLLVDLGCGSAVFTHRLADRGIRTYGLDLSMDLLQVACKGNQHSKNCPVFIQGDVENLPFGSESVDLVLLSGLLHHLPNLKPCIQEVHRILRPNGRIFSFDPNRLNPAMWLYRTHHSPFYSSKGVTPNEEPVSPNRLAEAFRQQGFDIEIDFLSPRYKYVASDKLRGLLGLYNIAENILFRPSFLRKMRAFILLQGRKITEETSSTKSHPVNPQTFRQKDSS